MGKRLAVFILLLSLVAFGAASAKSSKAKGHPEKMGTADCIECHVDVTPEAYQQWEQSAHGFTGVKCQVCHGDEKNFKKIPDQLTCIGCHDHEAENNTAPKVTCITCHKAHTFLTHKPGYTPTDVK
jgi:hypothetical protein